MLLFFTLLLISSTSAQLKTKATKIYVGTAINSNALSSDAKYKQLAGQQFDSLTAEWEMKMDPIEKNQNQFDFTLGDQIVAFGQQNGMKIRGHALVWHESLPQWVKNLNGNKPALQKVLTDYITTTVNHYKGKVYCWDVVNEVIGDDAKMRSSIWYNNFGTDFIKQAFTLTNKLDPSAKLYINDYSVEGTNAKSDALYNLVKTLKSQGVPIQGVGFQAHFAAGQVPADLQANLQRFANLGVDVAITELDIRVNTPASAASLAQQAKDYAFVANACQNVSRCVGITVWGFTDKYSWVPNTFPGQGASNLYDSNYNQKSAYISFNNALR